MNKTPLDIQQMDKKIQEFRSKAQKNDSQNGKFVYAYQIGTRIAAELVSGVLVGAGLGYLLDKIFHTAPTLLIVFLILGGISGFLNVYRFVKKEDRKEESNV